MTQFVENILNVPPALAYVIVACLVFAEDALFVGFVIPGETAAVLGGVVASRGNVQLGLMVAVVVAAAAAGDSVGYEIGKHLGPRFLELRVFRKKRKRLGEAQEFLRGRGGPAVFLGRFVAFFRAVMPALAGSARMPYLRFLTFNVSGAIVWGVGFVVLGYVAGNSYEAVAQAVGRDIAVAVGLMTVIGVIIWQVRRARRDPTGTSGAG